MIDSQETYAERTKRGALDVLLKQLTTLRPNIDDCAAREILTAALATDILETAWRHQFDDDRSACRKKIHDLVEFAIEEREVEAADAATTP